MVDDDTGHLVAGPVELVGELLDEDSEVGSRRAGIHLRNE
jgi:hypothetical protein